MMLTMTIREARSIIAALHGIPAENVAFSDAPINDQDDWTPAAAANALDPKTYAAVCDYIRAYRYVEAIKLVRGVTGHPLRDSKAIVDSIRSVL